MSVFFKRLLQLLLFSPLWGYFIYILLNNFIIYYKIISFILIITSCIALLSSRFNLKLPKYYFLLVLYIVYISYWSYITKLGLTSILYHLSLIAFIILLNNINLSAIDIKSIIKIFKLTILISLIVILIQMFDSGFFMNKYFIETNLHSTLYTARRTAIFSFADKDDIGLSFLPILSIVIAHSTYKRNRLLWMWIIMGAIICMLTNTRYIMVGFIIIVFQLFNYYKIKIAHVIKLFILFIIIGFLFYQIVLLLGYNFQAFFEQRLFKEGSIENTSRFLAYETFLNFYGDNWFWGTGVHLTEDIEKFIGGKSSQIHVGYLSHLVSYGLFGSLFLFSFWFALGKDLYRKAKKTKYYGSFYAYLVFVWANFTFVEFSLISYGLLFAFVIERYYYIEYQKTGNTFFELNPVN